jgi:hypothetical protein
VTTGAADLREALETAAGPSGRVRFLPPTKAGLPDVARSLMARYGSSEEPRRSAAQLAALLQRLRAAQFDWDSVSPTDRLDVAWVLWSGEQKPAEQPEFLRTFLDWVETPWRRAQARRLAIAWAEAADSALASIRTVGAFLAARAGRLGPPWSHLAAEFDIFALARGPALLAEAFLAATESTEDFLDRIALNGRAAAGGLLLEALAAAAECVETRLAKQPRLAARLAALSVHRQGFRPAAMARAMPGRAGEVGLGVAEALLLPWQDCAPPPAVKTEITDYLLRHYGDARVRDLAWATLRPPSRAIMHRWLTARTVDSFFRLTGDGAADRRFWTAYGDHIDDAWLLAGPASAARLKETRLGHGKVAGCRPDFCALLLGIRGMTIARMSGEASWRAWLPRNNLAPPLYGGQTQPCFPAALGNGADFSPAYSRQNDGLWQDALHDFIKIHTGLSIPRNDYLT